MPEEIIDTGEGFKVARLAAGHSSVRRFCDAAHKAGFKLNRLQISDLELDGIASMEFFKQWCAVMKIDFWQGIHLNDRFGGFKINGTDSKEIAACRNALEQIWGQSS